ncbi:MAG: LysE family translocator [Acidobacteria bacterium]|nr:LysE family translocator [Acidobacteriota bacterium]
MEPRFWVFVGLVALLTITPGADTALVVRSTLSRGRAAALLTVAGICAGCLTHSVFSAFGLSMVLSRSAAAFDAVKFAGALYLAWLGVQSLLAAWKGHDTGMVPLAGLPAKPQKPWRSFSEGLLTNLLNPKMPLFYVTFLPQFVDPKGNVLLQSMLLASVHVAMGFVWLGGFALFLDRLSGYLRRDTIRRRLEAATGAIFLALGFRLALEER